jgi:hypothetical protein
MSAAEAHAMQPQPSQLNAWVCVQATNVPFLVPLVFVTCCCRWYDCADDSSYNTLVTGCETGPVANVTHGVVQCSSDSTYEHASLSVTSCDPG